MTSGLQPKTKASPPSVAFAGIPGRLASAFVLLENRPMLDLVARDVLCFNLPQFALARTKDEFLDMAPNSLALTGVTVGSMVALPPLLRHPVSWIARIPVAELKRELTADLIKKLPVQNKLARLAVATGFLFPFATGFMAAPFLRNLLTLKRTGTTDFEQLIGLGKQQVHRQNYEKQMQAQKSGLIKTLAWGAGLGATGLLAFSLAARLLKNPVSLKNTRIDTLFKTFALRGKQSSEVSGVLSTGAFWLLPPYLGWLIAARSRNERIEHAVKATNSVLWFCLFTPLFVKDYFLKKLMNLGVDTQVAHVKNRWIRSLKGVIPSYNELENLPAAVKAQALGMKNKYMMASWLLPVLLLAATPQLINIYFTQKRVRNKQQKALSSVANQVSNTQIPTKFPIFNVTNHHANANVRSQIPWTNPIRPSRTKSFSHTPAVLTPPLSFPGLKNTTNVKSSPSAWTWAWAKNSTGLNSAPWPPVPASSTSSR